MEKDGSSTEEGPSFTLMNESIQGYVGLTEDHKAFTIVPPYVSCLIFHYMHNYTDVHRRNQRVVNSNKQVKESRL